MSVLTEHPVPTGIIQAVRRWPWGGWRWEYRHKNEFDDGFSEPRFRSAGLFPTPQEALANARYVWMDFRGGP